MKINIIKQLAEEFDHETLLQLTTELENGDPLSKEVGGDDEGEQLTHLLAASWIVEQMAANNTELKTELRNYTSRVRSSIS